MGLGLASHGSCLTLRNCFGPVSAPGDFHLSAAMRRVSHLGVDQQVYSRLNKIITFAFHVSRAQAALHFSLFVVFV